MSDRLNSILHHADVWHRIAPDGMNPIIVPERSDYQYDYYQGGVVIFHPYLDGLKIHPTFIPGYRGAHALHCIRKSLEFCPVTVYAEIAPTLKHVRAMAVLAGFELIGRAERYLYWRLP